MENKVQKNKQESQEREQETNSAVSLAPLDFEDALSSLLQTKPAKNSELKKSVPQKKKSKPKTKK